jgi:hypothetical protein
MPTSNTTVHNDSGTDLEARDRRALQQYLTVLPDTGRADGEELFLIVSESGSEYLVDIELGACECPDFRHRTPEGGCKHLRRVAFVTGRRPIPASIDREQVDDHIGEHVDTDLRYVATDGGSTESESIFEHVSEDALVDELGHLDPTMLPFAFSVHRESSQQGGKQYWRCEHCGVESIRFRPHVLTSTSAHRDGCDNPYIHRR